MLLLLLFFLFPGIYFVEMKRNEMRKKIRIKWENSKYEKLLSVDQDCMYGALLLAVFSILLDWPNPLERGLLYLTNPRIYVIHLIWNVHRLNKIQVNIELKRLTSG